MAQFHFVEDYEKLVDSLVAQHPLDVAMTMAVGGAYHEIGAVEVDILRSAGLSSGQALLDIGCGSGRLAHALGKSGLTVDYTGVDIVQKLLDYAASMSPASYRFVLHRQLSIPAADSSLDMVSAFSLFTHLLHHETFIYLQDARRALKSGGLVVLSFLEFAAAYHWNTFLATVEQARVGVTPHLNTFMERSVIVTWAARLDFSVASFIEPEAAIGPAGPLGQSIVILRKR